MQGENIHNKILKWFRNRLDKETLPRDPMPKDESLIKAGNKVRKKVIIEANQLERL